MVGRFFPSLSTLLAIGLVLTGPRSIFFHAHARRIVSVADLHGDYPATIKALLLAGVIPPEGPHTRWVGGDTILVQTGDIVDRGDNSREIFQLLFHLGRQAVSVGGAVEILLGNHEIARLTGDYRFLRENETHWRKPAVDVDGETLLFDQDLPTVDLSRPSICPGDFSCDAGVNDELEFGHWGGGEKGTFVGRFSPESEKAKRGLRNGSVAQDRRAWAHDPVELRMTETQLAEAEAAAAESEGSLFGSGSEDEGAGASCSGGAVGGQNATAPDTSTTAEEDSLFGSSDTEEQDPPQDLVEKTAANKLRPAQDGWLRAELKRKASALFVVSDVLFVHGVLEPEYVDEVLIPLAEELFGGENVHIPRITRKQPGLAELGAAATDHARRRLSPRLWELFFGRNGASSDPISISESTARNLNPFEEGRGERLRFDLDANHVWMTDALTGEPSKDKIAAAQAAASRFEQRQEYLQEASRRVREQQGPAPQSSSSSPQTLAEEVVPLTRTQRNLLFAALSKKTWAALDEVDKLVQNVGIDDGIHAATLGGGAVRAAPGGALEGYNNFLIGQKSPFWSRAYEKSCGDSNRVLRWLGVKKIVGGHTPCRSVGHGKVLELCGGRAVIADVGMSKAYRKDFGKANIVVVEAVEEGGGASARMMAKYEAVKFFEEGGSSNRFEQMLVAPGGAIPARRRLRLAGVGEQGPSGGGEQGPPHKRPRLAESGEPSA